jgi:hypothetical protein
VMQSNATSTLFLVCLLALSSAHSLCNWSQNAIPDGAKERQSPR